MPYILEKNGNCLNYRRTRFEKLIQSGNFMGNFAIDIYGCLWSWGMNQWAQCGQGNPLYDSEEYEYLIMENRNITEPRLVLTNEGKIKDDWVTVCGGEGSAMAMDRSGRLWGCGAVHRSTSDPAWYGYNCAAFGLPHDSGTDGEEWRLGEGRDGRQVYFYYMTPVLPGWRVDDYVHVTYYTLFIPRGENTIYRVGTGGRYVTGYGSEEYKVGTVEPEKIDFLEEYSFDKIYADLWFGDNHVARTLDNRIIAWGGLYHLFEDNIDYFYTKYLYNRDGSQDTDPRYTIRAADITLNLPVDKYKVVSSYVGYYAAFTLMSDGTLWALGWCSQTGRGDDGEDVFDRWIKVEGLPPIQEFSAAQGGPIAKDFSGYVYTWTEMRSFSLPDMDAEPTTEDYYPDCGGEYNEYPDLMLPFPCKEISANAYEEVNFYIDMNGDIYAWGTQWYGDHLGSGIPYTSDDYIRATCKPLKCAYKPYANLDESKTEYGPFKMVFEPLEVPEQGETHFPCGYWFTRTWETTVEPMQPLVFSLIASTTYSVPPKVINEMVQYRWSDTDIFWQGESVVPGYHHSIEFGTHTETYLDGDYTDEVVYTQDGVPLYLMENTTSTWDLDEDGEHYEIIHTIPAELMAKYAGKYIYRCEKSVINKYRTPFYVWPSRRILNIPNGTIYADSQAVLHVEVLALNEDDQYTRDGEGQEQTFVSASLDVNYTLPTEYRFLKNPMKYLKTVPLFGFPDKNQALAETDKWRKK